MCHHANWHVTHVTPSHLTSRQTTSRTSCATNHHHAKATHVACSQEEVVLVVALESSTVSSKGRWQGQPGRLARGHPPRNCGWMPAGHLARGDWMPGPLGWVGHLPPGWMAPMVPSLELPVLELPVLELPVLELPVLELPVLEVAVLELPVLEVAVLELPAPELQQMPCTARI